MRTTSDKRVVNFKQGALFSSCALGLVLSPLSGITVAQKARPRIANGSAPRVGIIRRAEGNGCGCVFQFPADYKKRNNRRVFESYADNNAIMNLNGRDVDLALVSSTEPTDPYSTAKQFTETYKGGGYKLKLYYKLKNLCPPNDEGCEVVWYEVVVTVSSGDQSSRFNAFGTCGC